VGAAAAVALAAAAVAVASAEDRAIAFWPNAVPAAIHAQIDGRATLELVREISRFHRVQGSPGFAAATEMLLGKLRRAGFAGSSAAIEKFPADGRIRYAHFVSYYGWNPIEATLDEVRPRPGPVSSFPELAVALADYSQDADVTAELVDVGRGTDSKDYAGKNVRGRIVLADGPLPEVHELAVIGRGAAGFLSAFPNQTTAWSGDDRDLVRWGHLSAYETRNTFAFMLSKRQAEEYRRRMAAGETITLAAHVRAKIVPATFDVVNAAIRGSDPSAGEVVLTAHFCHESAGANDNASGSAVLLEVARALRGAIARGALPEPKRTIRFLWLPEIAGSQAWLIRNREVARRSGGTPVKFVAGVHLDMVGGLLSTTRGTLHVSRSAETLPHVVNEIADAFVQEVLAASSKYAEHGGDAASAFVWPPGSREALLADVRAVELGSDHQVFQDSSFAVPMVYFHDWPDVTIHTNKDLPENLDATKLGRVAYMAAGIAWTLAALPDDQAPRLLSLTAANAEARIARAGFPNDRSPRDWALARRETVERSAATVRSVGELWPSVAGVAHEAERGIRGLAPEIPADDPGDRRVPSRNPDVVGPLGVYYFDFLERALGAGAVSKIALAKRDDGDVLAWEAFNLVDGKRSISEIRDVLAGRYAPVSLAEIAEYVELLARAKAVSIR
jgi:aminopeptidase YwaD